jgi:hypothetical protein
MIATCNIASVNIPEVTDMNYLSEHVNPAKHDTLVSCAKIYMLLNRKSASIYRYLMRVTLSNFQCFIKPITAFMDD